MSIEKIRKEIQDLKDKMVELCNSHLIKESKKIFNDFPKLNSFGWPQYTPYFNDGDVCHFYACRDEESIFLNGYNIDELDEEEFVEENGLTIQEAEIISKRISKALSLFSDRELEDMYGEGLITFYRDGSFVTKEYMHD